MYGRMFVIHEIWVTGDAAGSGSVMMSVLELTVPTLPGICLRAASKLVTAIASCLMLLLQLIRRAASRAA